MQTPISKILKMLMDQRDLSQVDLSRATGVGQSTISRILSPEGVKGIQNPSDTHVKKIADYFGLSTDQLRGHSPIDWESGEAGVSGDNISPAGGLDSRMPLIGWVAAGDWCESPDNFAPGDAEEWLPRPDNAGPRSFALKVINDSMKSPYPGERSYPPGIIIYVDPDKPVTNGCRAVARANNEYTFKQYVEDSGRVYLKPLNPQYPTLDVTDDVHICGVVFGSYMPE